MTSLKFTVFWWKYLHFGVFFASFNLKLLGIQSRSQQTTPCACKSSFAARNSPFQGAILAFTRHLSVGHISQAHLSGCEFENL